MQNVLPKLSFSPQSVHQRIREKVVAPRVVEVAQQLLPKLAFFARPLVDLHLPQGSSKLTFDPIQSLLEPLDLHPERIIQSRKQTHRSGTVKDHIPSKRASSYPSRERQSLHTGIRYIH